MLTFLKIKSTIFIVLMLNFLTGNSAVYAQWWNPLAPKDFDECVIKNLKPGMGEDAVRALQYSCIKKYPPKSSAAEKLAEEKSEERYKKCFVEKNHWKTQRFLTVGSNNSYKTSEILAKLKTLDFDRNSNKVSFQNMNFFGISGFMVGFTGDKQCPQTTDKYRFSTYCSSGSTERGVASSAYGSLSCGQLPKESRALGFCAIGYSPMYNQFDESLLEFLEGNNYCN